MKKFDVTVKYDRTFKNLEFSSLEEARKFYRDTYGDYASVDIVEKELKYLVGSIFHIHGIADYMLVSTKYKPGNKKGKLDVGFIVHSGGSGNSNGLACNLPNTPVYEDGMTLNDIATCLGVSVSSIKVVTACT